MAPGLEWPRAAHRLVYTSSNRVRKKPSCCGTKTLRVLAVFPGKLRVSSDRRRRVVAVAGPSESSILIENYSMFHEDVRCVLRGLG